MQGCELGELETKKHRQFEMKQQEKSIRVDNICSGYFKMAKALYCSENKDLVKTIERYTDVLIFTMQMKQVIEILSAVKASKSDEKTAMWDTVSCHMSLLDAMQTASRKAFKREINTKQYHI